MRFIKYPDYYMDIKTDLKWSLENFGPMTWEKAMEFCIKKEGFWSFPSIEELFTLIDFSIAKSTLPNMKLSNYWSSNIYANNPEYAWYIRFSTGYVFNSDKTNMYYVRAVCGEMK